MLPCDHAIGSVLLVSCPCVCCYFVYLCAVSDFMFILLSVPRMNISCLYYCLYELH
uniref:Uncharacterized protein n=1 Tax=Arundo donax TaxID=35708 RepID=A0A0A9FBI7_ARUDO